MSSLARATTPVKQTAPAAATESPGTWRHPRLDEITRRRDATNFSEKNVRRIAYNIVALLAMWSLQLLAKFNVDAQM
jgi:nucleoporin POM34